MAGPEANLTRRIHRRLVNHPALYFQKMDTGRGTPDYYYEGHRAHMWVEYKVHPNGLSWRQKVWIERALRNKQPVRVAIWHPKEKEMRVGADTYTFDGYITTLAELEI